MANYIITKNKDYFKKIGKYNYCDLEQLDFLPEMIAVDTETTGLFALVDDMFCIQIGTGKDNYIVVMYNDDYVFEDVIPYLKGKILVLQNAKFDLGFFYMHGFVPDEVRDTMLAYKILHNGDIMNQRSDFKTLMEKELGVVYSKTDQKNINVVKLSQPSTIKYSFNDVDKLLELHEVLYKQIVDGGYKKTYQLHCRFVRALAYMELCGLPLNVDKWQSKMDVDKANVEKYSIEVEEYIYNNAPDYADNQLDLFSTQKRARVNLKSPKQMIGVFQSLGINTKDSRGKDSIKEDVITKTKHPFVDLWLKFQGAKHRVSTFGQGVLDQEINGRIYTNFNPMVDTARLSSRKGSINFLNFPADDATRKCFEAKEGNRMIVCDWSGQETVLAADLSGDEAMTKSVQEGADLHSMLARVLFPELEDLDDETIMTVHAKKRKKSKAPRFAMQYGGNAYTLHVNENIPLSEAEDIYEKFIKLHQGLFDWGHMVFKASAKVGYITSVDGWRLKLPKFDWYQDLEKEVKAITKGQWALYRIGKQERQRERMLAEANKKREKGTPKKEFVVSNQAAYDFYKSRRKGISDYFKLQSEYKRLSLNNPVQTRGAHQMKLALCLFFEWIVKNKYMWKVLMCNAVHDEIVAEAPNHLAMNVKKQVEKSMIDGGNHYLTKLKMKADADVGDTWGDAK